MILSQEEKPVNLELNYTSSKSFSRSNQGLLLVEDHQGLGDVVIAGFLGVVAACPFPAPRTEEDPIAMSEQALNSS